MKAKKQDMSVRELFRQKLGENEIIPDPSVRAKIMRKQAGIEFLRFNPARFNIYYLAGIVAATIVSVMIVTKPEISSSNSVPDDLSKNVLMRDTFPDINNSQKPLEIQMPEKISKKALSGSNNQKNNKPRVVSSKEAVSKGINSGERTVSFSDVNDSFAKNGLLIEPSTEKNKLQGGFKKSAAVFETSATTGCAPLTLHFTNKSDPADSCRWTFGDGGYSNVRNPEWIFDVEGDYKVVLNVFGIGGVQSTYSTVITVYPKPQARFEISPENAVLPKDEVTFYNYSSDAVHNKWEFGDGKTSELPEPRHIYEKSGIFNIRLIVTSDHGCTDSLTVMNAFSGSEYFIDFPNAFIPNIQGPTGGLYSAKIDESAQVFHPVFSGVADYQLRIFSKLGIQIFESNDVNIGWDGYMKGQLSEPGVYVWKVRGKFRNGEPFTKMGDLTLVRY